jgi:hypothetical protein
MDEGGGMETRRIPLEGDKLPDGFGLSVDALEKSFPQLEEHLKAHGWKDRKMALEALDALWADGAWDGLRRPEINDHTEAVEPEP